MESTNKEDFFNIIKKHLQHPKCVIAITQGDNKFARPDVQHNKYNWFKTDIEKHYQTVENFIKSLPSHGFTNGAKLNFRRMEGNRAKFRGDCDLQFATTSAPPITPVTTTAPTPEVKNNTMQTVPVTQPNHQQQAVQPVQQLAAPQAVQGMAYASVPQHEVISMKVKLQRYDELADKLRKSEKKLDQCEADYRQEKQKLFDAERKLDLLEDRHQLKIDIAEKNRKGFLDSETGKELVSGLSLALPKVLENLTAKPQPAVGLGNPLAAMSAIKQQFISEFQQLDDSYIEVLRNTLARLTNEEFAQALMQMIETSQPEQPNQA